MQGGVGRSSAGAGSYSVSGTGTLAYAGALSTPGRLTWFDRGGTPSESAGSLGDYTDFRLSPDETRLAASLADPKTGLPWVSGLDDVRKRVFIEMVFNMGSRILSFHESLRLSKAGRWHAAATAFTASLWARQVGARAATLTRMLETGQDPPA